MFLPNSISTLHAILDSQILIAHFDSVEPPSPHEDTEARPASPTEKVQGAHAT